MMKPIPALALIAAFIFPFAARLQAQIPSNPLDDDTLNVAPEHKPGTGFPVVKSRYGGMSISAFVTARYLNQEGLEGSYTDAFGRTSSITRRNDIQFQKVMVYFLGWVMDPRFRYVLYAWTSNTNQGLGAQVVLGGNLQYKINKYLDVGVGIGGAPATRSLIGSWPQWTRQDTRPMAEEFFRPSFSTGIWSQGELAKGLYYKTFLGNNLSQLGIDAGQLDDGLDTWSSMLWWCRNGYERLAYIGDYNKTPTLGTFLGASYTRSNETRQSQPGSESPENSQLRLSDGTSLFALDAFNNGSNITDARYQMSAIQSGIKYKGFSLDAEYYMRWLDKFQATGPLPQSRLFDQGYVLHGSAMLKDKLLQAYGVYSAVDGEYGNPWEVNVGLNWFVFRNRVVRINAEYTYTHNSPVGYLAYPTVVGARGSLFMLNLELYY